MFNFPKVSMIRFPKLIAHSILLTVALTFLLLFSSDIAGWILKKPVEISDGFLTLFVLTWCLFAMQNKKYQK